ncbi:hypothetical protein, variant [Aphanomyces invadans]|uniref:Tetratricopeptide repeat protein 29 n=1 Tax=Aphanomyces invadans TaxID=157072 RepID=A0A024UAI2_9STRA|nr:hypothetical protein, variant [Aphanomyces invadans]ETW03284.1 hypothetical protein, variant [Aphanomyces invadans]|eukprot:XP_008867513.1 hypothetical protein, variant [Aphanomyces invadans]
MVDVDGMQWWRDTIYPQAHVSRDEFKQKLFQCSRIQLPQMSMKEASVYLDICIELKSEIMVRDWERFLVRFGPFSKCVVKAVQCFQDRVGVAPWFHGAISRAEAEKLTTHADDGAFLVRFSETQPDKFTLTYMKVHSDPVYHGRKEIKNVLIVHNPREGYGLQDGGNGRQYPSIASFIEGSSARLRTPIVSRLSIECNRKLKDLQGATMFMFSSSSAFNGAASEYSNLSTNDLVTSAHLDHGVGHFGASSSCHGSGVAPSSDYTTLKHGDVHPRPDASSTYATFAQLSTSVGRQQIEANNGTAHRQPSASVVCGHFNPLETNHTEKGGFISLDYGRLPPAYAAVSQTTAAGDEYGRFGPPPPMAASTSGDVYGQFGMQTTTSTVATTTGQTPLLTNAPGQVSDYGMSSNVRAENKADPQPPNDYGQLGQVHLVDRFNKGCGHFGPGSVPSQASADGTYGHFSSNAPPQSSSASLPSTGGALHPTHPRSAADAPHLPDYGRFDQAFSTAAQASSLGHHSMVHHNSDSTWSHSNTRSSFAVATVSTATTSLPLTRNAFVDRQGPETKPPLQGKEDAIAHIESGMALYKERNLDDAISCFLRAEHCAKAAGEKPVEARALGNLGTVYLDKKLPKDAMRYYIKCLGLTRDVEDKKRERIILNNLVLASIASGDTTAALKYSTELLAITAVPANRLKIESRIRTLQEELRRPNASPSALQS